MEILFSLCTLILPFASKVEALYGDDGIDRNTLRRWVADVDPTLEQSLAALGSDKPSYLFYARGTDNGSSIDESDLMKASRVFASSAGKAHLKLLRETDEEFKAFDEDEQASKQQELCKLARSGSSLVSPETADCLCGDTDDVFVHCEALLEQETIRFVDKDNTARTTTVEISLSKTDYLTLCEVEVFSKNGDKLQLSEARQSSVDYSGPAARAIDGNKDQNWRGASCTHTRKEANAWWRATVQYQAGDPPARIVVYNRNILQSRLAGFRVKVGGTSFTPASASASRDIYEIDIPAFGAPTSALALASAPKRGGCDVSCSIADVELCNRLQNADFLDLPAFVAFFESLSEYAFLEEGAEISLDCSIPLRPLPFDVHFGARASGGGFDVETLTVTHEQAENYSVGFSGEVCLPGAKDDFLGFIFDVLEFFGVSGCPLSLAASVHPLIGTLEAAVEANLFILKTNVDITWLFEDSIRNDLGVCDGKTECSVSEYRDCAMCKGDTFIRGKITARILFWEFSSSNDSHSITGCRTDGENGVCRTALEKPPCTPDNTVCFAGTSCNDCCNRAYNVGGTQCGGEPWADGTVCLAGTTCKLCKNRAYNALGTQCGGTPWKDGELCGVGTTCELCENGYSYWVGKLFTACGQEPCWGDGTVCLAGTTCDMCCNGAYNALGTQCGGNPWKDGELCGIGTTCNLCENGHSWWVGKAITACGVEPCWNDGTVCLAGTTCDMCCNGAYNALGTQCGGKAWADGTACGVGTTCNLCANGHSFWVGKAFTACGKEPCWSDNTVCGAGTTCDLCCNRAYNALGTQCGGRAWSDGTACGLGTTCNLCRNGYSWWVGKAFTACGREPCWGRGTVCGAGTTCNSCCRGADCPWYQFGVCTCK